MYPSKIVITTALVILLFSTQLLPAAPTPEAIEVTYLGNEGFLVRCGSQAILFDALFGAGLPDYDRVPANVVHDMDTGAAPFAQISAVFISHLHPDHFNAASTISFLKTHPSTVVVAPNDVSRLLRGALAQDRRMLSQLRPTPARRGQIVVRAEGGIRFEAFPLPHGQVENLAYLVLFNGRTVLHLGDADLPMKELAQLNLSHRRIDLAFIPFWHLTENAAYIRDQLHATVIVPMHLVSHPTTASSKEYLNHIGGLSGMLAKIRLEFPNAAVFRTPPETKKF